MYGPLLLVPALLIAGITVRLLAYEQGRLISLVQSSAREQLRSVAQQLELTVRLVQNELQQTLMGMSSSSSLKDDALPWLERTHPLVRNVFIWRGAGELVLPDTSLPMTGEQRSFLQRYNTLFNGSRSWMSVGQEPGAYEGPSLSSRFSLRSSKKSVAVRGGWIPWYWEDQLGMIGWVQPDPTGPRYGIELEMAALFSDLFSVLPGDVPENRLLALTDGSGRFICQSGGLDVMLNIVNTESRREYIHFTDSFTFIF